MFMLQISNKHNAWHTLTAKTVCSIFLVLAYHIPLHLTDIHVKSMFEIIEYGNS